MRLTPRAYQLAIYNSIIEKGNTLVVLPTGLGKTLLALMVIKDKIKEGRCLFVTPTKPLAKQHYESVKKILEIEDVQLITGEIPAEKRKEMYKSSVIISTPQTVRNDLESNITTPDFVLFIVDEAHRAVGDYAYVQVAMMLESALIVGLTASPGGKRERINEVMKNLRIQNIEIRTKDDPDVRDYIKKSTINWINTSLSPTLLLIKKQLDGLISKHAKTLGSMGFPPPLRHKGQFLAMRKRILESNNNLKYPAIMQYTILLNLLHMVELLETQGIFALSSYIEKFKEKTTKSAALLKKSTTFQEIVESCNTDEEHPKLRLLLDLVKKLKGKKIIVFAQYRDQVKLISDTLSSHGISSRIFLGKKGDYTKKQQEQTINEFQQEKFDVLCSSSIAEEGLDIPAVDAVIFYEPIPSEIRTIQRRGRAARLKEGEVYILITKGTRDEYYYWSSKRRESKMKTILTSMQLQLDKKTGRETSPRLSGQTKMVHFFD